MARPSYEDYLYWHKQELGDELESVDLSSRYQANVTLLKSSFETHSFMTALSEHFSTLAKQGLFQGSPKTPEIILALKPYPSLLNKLFRLNCLWNRSWPTSPQNGWICYNDLYSRVDDLVRTTIICKYLDGPEIVARNIEAAAKASGLDASCSPKATDTGYYGWHAYVRFPQKLMIGDKGVDLTAITEFQIITQLQAVLRDLTHRFYETARSSPTVARNQSRWNYTADSFRAEYLGHTLHLVDAMILELRDTQGLETEDRSGNAHNDG